VGVHNWGSGLILGTGDWGENIKQQHPTQATKISRKEEQKSRPGHSKILPRTETLRMTHRKAKPNPAAGISGPNEQNQLNRRIGVGKMREEEEAWWGESGQILRNLGIEEANICAENP
jgi:hypothetical protein